MTFPTRIPQRKLDITANRLRDELGKGAEALRKFGPLKLTATATETRQIIGIPQVDVKIVGVQIVGEGATAVTAELIAPAAYSDAAGSGNRLITAVPATSLTDDNVYHASLTALAGRVSAGQPIIAVLTDTGSQAGTVEFMVSYVLADQNEVSYEVYNVTVGEQPADVSGFPGARRAYNRYQTARTIADELGKGHEVLRSFQTTVGVPAGSTTNAIIGIPDVDIKVVSIDVLGNGAVDATDISITAPATYGAPATSGNRLSSDFDSVAATATVSNTENVSAGNTVTINGAAYTFRANITAVAATGTITGDGTAVSDGDTVTINGRAYTFKTALSAGPTVPDEILIGTAAQTLTNLYNAINAGAGIGTNYSTGTVVNADVSATNPTGTTVVLTALTAGTAGNSITLAENSTHLTVTGATLSGGLAANQAARDVLVGATASDSFTYLTNAINAGAGSGTTYGSSTTANSDVTAVKTSATLITLTAKSAGVAGNSLTLAKNGTNLGVSGATFSGGSDGIADNVIAFATLTKNAQRVKAFQPIMANVTGGPAGAGTLTFVVRYLLADIGAVGAQDSVLTYTNYGATTDLSGAKAFGTGRATRQLYSTAFRLADELGKNQEVLRQFPAATIVTSNGGGVQRLIIGVPDVDIRITDITLVGEGLAASSVDVIVPATFTESVATNKVMSQVAAAALPDDKVVHATLTGKANRVVAGQPIQLAVTDTGSQTGKVTAVVSYILADEGYGSKSPVTYAQ